MSQYIKVLKGTINRKDSPTKDVEDVIFPLVKNYRPSTKGGGKVTVDGAGMPGFPQFTFAIQVESPLHLEMVGESEAEEYAKEISAVGTTVPATATKKQKVEETDEQVMDRIGERFSILNEMTEAAINGDVRAMIVTGPPGVGKSYGVETTLERASLFDKIKGTRTRYDVVKGAMTALGLYAKLYEYSDRGNVLVFDDCDSVLFDELSLNILKAALDSGKRRRIHWNADSAKLRAEGIPNAFDFHGSAIFITNVKFENVRSKKVRDHLEALESRCHYLDLTLDTMRDKILRIKQIARSGELFKGYGLDAEAEAEVLEYMEENKDRLREMSLRTALKIGDLRKLSKDNWKRMAEVSILK